MLADATLATVSLSDAHLGRGWMDFASQLGQKKRERMLPSGSHTWKWKMEMDPWMTMFLMNGVVCSMLKLVSRSVLSWGVAFRVPLFFAQSAVIFAWFVGISHELPQ